MEFKDVLRSLRNQKYPNQRECAINMGIDPAKYNKWENGVNRPNYETLIEIANHYNVSIDYLLRGISAENVGIHDRIGLRDEAIRILEEYRDCWDGQIILKTLNELIENRLVLNDIARFLHYRLVGDDHDKQEMILTFAYDVGKGIIEAINKDEMSNIFLIKLQNDLNSLINKEV